jgi:hypothetical protein
VRRFGLVAIALAVVGRAGVARADLRVAFDNDIFAHFDPHDDDGFTNDLDIRFWRPYREYLIGGKLFDRWVTEEPRSAGGRRDLVELVATGERTWGDGPARALTVGARVGPTFTGNLGGRWMQNAFHTTCHCGARLDEGLQSMYLGDDDAGVLAGGTARGSLGLPWLQGYGVVDTQAAAGTGVTFLDTAAGASVIGRRGATEVGVHVELALMRFHVVDDQGLGMPGGYRPGWQTGYRAGGYVAHARFRIEYELHSNEGGSGSPIGIVALTFKQAGTAF